MDDYHYMRIAIEEARKAASKGEIPVGAVVVCDDKVISKAHNLRETTNDATAHAEIVAIKKASERLKRWRLNDCTLYVTLEPCPMCAGALVMSRVKRLVYGSPDINAGAAESIFNIVDNPNLNHKISVTSTVLEDECRQILQDFFSENRKK